MPRATETDRSGLTIAGAKPVYDAAQQPRDQVFFQNTSDTDMRIEFNAVATASSGRLIPANGGAYENPNGFVPAGALSVYCASADKAFVCKTV